MEKDATVTEHVCQIFNYVMQLHIHTTALLHQSFSVLH